MISMPKCKYCDNKADNGNNYCDRDDCKMKEAIRQFEKQKKELIETCKKDWRKQGLSEEEIKKKVKYTDEKITDCQDIKWFHYDCPCPKCHKGFIGVGMGLDHPCTNCGEQPL